MTRFLSLLATSAALLTASPLAVGAATSEARRLSAASPSVRVGERLFFDTRFAQFFFARCHGDVNAPLAEGDPAIDQLPFTATRSLASPFRGQSMSCRQCHLGDDLLLEEPLAGRTYCDFSRRTPIPRRDDDALVRTPRNTPLMVNVGLPRDVPVLLHFDGEFATVEDLVIETLTGRNFGWLPTEGSVAVAHIATVIRNDQGMNPRTVTYAGGGGVPYRVVLLGTDPNLPSALQLSQPDRIDVATASNEAILQAVANLMHAYTDSLRFGTTNTGRDSPSPYDVFLDKNGLPSRPRTGESGLAYAQRLLAAIRRRPNWTWVKEDDREFELHDQSFRFGRNELRGLQIFLTRSDPSRRAHVGNCVACHTPPQFTDSRLHNNGVSQVEYDGIFGRGAFAALPVPGLAARNADLDAYLPASPAHPNAKGRFRSAPSRDQPGYADLGVWNVFANPDIPKPQAALSRILCEQLGRTVKPCTAARLLPLTVAYFKTPSIRDLGQSNPYFHSGALDTIEEVLRFYVATSDLARAAKVRNPSPELSGVRLDATDIAPLAAFLRSLNEDYR